MLLESFAAKLLALKSRPTGTLNRGDWTSFETNWAISVELLHLLFGQPAAYVSTSLLLIAANIIPWSGHFLVVVVAVRELAIPGKKATQPAQCTSWSCEAIIGRRTTTVWPRHRMREHLELRCAIVAGQLTCKTSNHIKPGTRPTFFLVLGFQALGSDSIRTSTELTRFLKSLKPKQDGGASNKWQYQRRPQVTKLRYRHYGRVSERIQKKNDSVETRTKPRSSARMASAGFRLSTLLAIAACVTLVNLRAQAANLEDRFPALVIDEGEGNLPNTKVQAAPADASLTEPKQNDQAATTTSTTAPKDLAVEKDSKLIPYETKFESDSGSSERPTESSTETTSQASGSSVQPSNAPTDKDQSNDDETHQQTPKVEHEKDINVLLASSSEAENDLSSSGSQAPSVPVPSDATKPSIASQEDKKEAPVDSTIDLNKPSSSDDSFHYSIESSSGDKKASEPAAADANSKADSRPELQNSPEPSTATKEDETKVKPQDSLEAKREEPQQKAEETSTNKSPETERPKEDAPTTTTVASPTDNKAASETSSSTPVTTTELPVPKKSEAPSSDDQVKAKKDEPSTTEASKELAPTSTTVKPIKADEKPPASVPSILAVALGTALGAAATAAHPTPNLTGKDSKTGSASTTTRAPSSSGPKSATDRWDKWTPSSTSAAPSVFSTPPTRRRPILPSIRRRFRPQSRFPWSVDAYGESEFSASGESPSSKPSRAPSGTTPSSRDRKRKTSSTPSPSGTSSPKTVSSGSDEDEEDLDKPVDLNPSGRRGASEPPRRRHHHHRHQHGSLSPRRDYHGGHHDYDDHDHHHHHDHYHGHRHYGYGHGHDHGHGHGHGHGYGHGYHRHHYPADARPDFNSPAGSFGGPSGVRPPGGFGLFNSNPGAVTGNGFNLMTNPITDIIDEVASIATGRRPTRGRDDITVVVENEYNGNGRDRDRDRERDRDRDCRDDYYNGRPRPDRPRPERPPYRPDGYDRPNYRPDRPHRPDRPPYDDYDTYPSRPGRPYNRREGEAGEQPTPPVYSPSNESVPAARRSVGQEERRGSWPAQEPAVGLGKRQREEPESQEQTGPSLYSSGNRSSLGAGPRRIPSIFSPFDSLFDSPLDQGLFGLRSTLAGEASKPEAGSVLDSVVSSPKISTSVAANNGTSSVESSNIKPVMKEEATASESNGKPVEPLEVSGDKPSAKEGEESKQKEEPKREVEVQGVPMASLPEPQVPSFGLFGHPFRQLGGGHPSNTNLSPCASSRSLICLFVHKQTPLLDLFHRL